MDNWIIFIPGRLSIIRGYRGTCTMLRARTNTVLVRADVVIETVRLAEESAVTNIIKVENEDEDSTKIMKKHSRFSTIYDSPQRQGQYTGNDATSEGRSEARTIELTRAAQLELANYLSLPTGSTVLVEEEQSSISTVGTYSPKVVVCQCYLHSVRESFLGLWSSFVCETFKY